jgi:WD40 repeat protein
LSNNVLTQSGIIGQYASNGPVSAAFSPDGTKIISADYAFGGGSGIKLRDAQSFALIASIDNLLIPWGGNFALRPGRLTLSHDGKLLAVTTDSGIRLYNVSQELTGQPLTNQCITQPTNSEVRSEAVTQSINDFDEYGRPVE